MGSYGERLRVPSRQGSVQPTPPSSSRFDARGTRARRPEKEKPGGGRTVSILFSWRYNALSMNEPNLDDLSHNVPGKFTLVTLAMKRARQLKDGARPLIDTYSHKPVTIALQEILAATVRPAPLPPTDQLEAEEQAAMLAAIGLAEPTSVSVRRMEIFAREDEEGREDYDEDEDLYDEDLLEDEEREEEEEEEEDRGHKLGIGDEDEEEEEDTDRKRHTDLFTDDEEATPEIESDDDLDEDSSDDEEDGAEAEAEAQEEVIEAEAEEEDAPAPKKGKAAAKKAAAEPAPEPKPAAKGKKKAAAPEPEPAPAKKAPAKKAAAKKAAAKKKK
ncbi:MAG: DNA-directed RNA polymerase subunit omega [Armatimonadetes bacterium]|nr:DNA-directed RNA polymerase subunit omega [Armatimonadota bacterium]